MAAQHLQLARLALAGLSAQDKADFIREVTGAPAPQEPDRLLKPKDAAARLGVTARTIFSLMRTGALTRIRLPGRKLGCGVRNSEIAVLIAGGSKI